MKPKPYNFEKAWAHSRPLPSPPCPPETVKIPYQGTHESLLRLVDYLQGLQNSGDAWGFQECKAATQYLWQLREGLGRAEDWRRLLEGLEWPLTRFIARGFRKLEQALKNDIQRLTTDSHWRCLANDLSINILLSQANEAPSDGGVNFVAWPASSRGTATPNYTIDKIVIGAVSGGLALRGLQWLLGPLVQEVPIWVPIYSF